MTAMPPLTCWVVTDGAAGNLTQAQSLALAISRLRPLTITSKKIDVAAPWRRAPRQIWGDPYRRLSRSSDKLLAPFPQIWIGCGRLSVPFSIAAKKKSQSTYVVQLLAPRTRLDQFDLVVAPVHDALSGENVLSVNGALSGADIRRRAIRHSASTPSVCVLIGGPNGAFEFGRRDAHKIADLLDPLAAAGARLSVTTSRRTPLEVTEILRARLADRSQIFYRGGVDPEADNPYPSMLAECDHVLVTEDSVNMATEASMTGAPVQIISLVRRRFARAQKFDRFHEFLRSYGAARPFTGALEDWSYEPLDEAARAAQAIVERLDDFGSRPSVR